MSDENLSWFRRVIRSVRGHLRVAGIAVIYGMTAYGFVYLLYWGISYVEEL